ncbi:MAG: hypothetical protein IT372_00390 [Polyangiaceae bacterium]|nr:hypothetical protein [Polyangiaceae bacterium]
MAEVPAANGAPATPAHTSVLGKVFDGPTPSQIVWEKAAEEGACVLLTPRVPFCNTPCGGSAACVEDDTCQDYPLAHSAGKVTVTGVHTASGEDGFSMEPVANNYQTPAGVTLAYPGFAEGEDIAFEAAGDHFSAFSLTAKGVSPLELLTDPIPVAADQPVQLAWTPPGQAGISRIHVKLDISHHGGTKGMIQCDADDAGSLEIPAALVTQLTNLGVAGFPSIIIARRAVGSTTISPGRVDLVIASDVERQVEIAGLESCTTDADCAAPETCQDDLTCK